MKMTDNKARKILDFLTKRMGYESWKLYDLSTNPGLMYLEFNDKNNFGVTLLVEQDGQLKDWCFYSDTSIKDIIKLMVKNIDRAYCCRNPDMPPHCKELICTAPWIYVFKPNETLESLLIEMDLENE